MYEWMTRNGTGYEIVLTPQLYMSAKAVEVAGAIPAEDAEPGGETPGSEDAE
jgi:hypothetical protein